MIKPIQTPRLTVRPVEAGDWRSIQKIWEDFNASPLSCYDIPHRVEDDAVRTQIAKWAEANSGTAHLFFAVWLGEVLIGYIACNRRETGYELGYCFHSACHGNGYAKESHLAVLEHLRSQGVRRLTAGTALANAPSVALLHSLGFAQIGTEQVSFYRDAAGNAVVFNGGIFEKML